MLSVQIAISNLTSTNYQDEPPQELTLHFGPIATALPLQGGNGGKCLFLSLTSQKLQEIYQNYACGLFLQTEKGKYFGLLSLEQLGREDQVVCEPVTLCNDLREVKYTCQFSFVAGVEREPRVTDVGKMVQREAVAQAMKKPSIPNQPNNFTNPSKKPSFLYGSSTPSPDNLQTLKQGLRKQAALSKQLTQSKPNPLPKSSLSKQIEDYPPTPDDDLFPLNPPLMEFTNEQQTPKLQVPQLQIIELADSADRPTHPNFPKNYDTPGENFATFNRKGIKKQTEESSPSPSQFQLVRKEGKGKLTKAQIKQQAKMEAESRGVKENVLIPIARGERFELVPLSALSAEEIVDYVQRQRRNEEVARANQERGRRLEEREREVGERSRKMQVQERREGDAVREGELQRRLSREVRGSVQREIKQQVHDEQLQGQEEDDYLSDFQSASVSNSAIKSRISSRGNQRNNVSVSKQQQSVAEDDYSAEFDSYSQSALSRTNPNRNKANSISDLSESYRSISTSFRK